MGTRRPVDGGTQRFSDRLRAVARVGAAVLAVVLAVVLAAALPYVLARGAAVQAQASEAPGAPQRIVSINLCADALLLALADADQIAALTALSHDARYFVGARQAQRFPATRGRAEDVLALAPDLVLASTFTAPATVSLLRRLGAPLRQLDAVQDWPAIHDQIRAVAAAIGREDRGEAVIAATRERLDELARQRPLPKLSVLALQANNIVAGAGTLADTVIRSAGLTNAAARAGAGGQKIASEEIHGHARMSLEAILALAPDVLLVDGDENTAPARANRLLHHPALEALIDNGARTLTMPSRLWVCGGPDLVEAVAHLRRGLERTHASGGG